MRPDYFGLRRAEHTDPSGTTTDFQLTYGDWIRLFRANRLLVEDLIELRPPEDADTTYDDYAPLEWARAFPGEHIWKVRKAPDAGMLVCARLPRRWRAAAILAAAALTATPPPRAHDHRLNIVVILTDDQSFDTLPSDPPALPWLQSQIRRPGRTLAVVPGGVHPDAALLPVAGDDPVGPVQPAHACPHER